MQLAASGVFRSLQGEGALRGKQMVFVRLAGCGMGCAECDTNWQPHEDVGVKHILSRVEKRMPAGIRDPWVWITGGEPTEQDLRPLISGLRAQGYLVALATNGERLAKVRTDFLSVSPHTLTVRQRWGDEVKLVEGLAGLGLEEAAPGLEPLDFAHKWVQPLWLDGHEHRPSLENCRAFLKDNPDWGLSRQDHKHWGVM